MKLLKHIDDNLFIVDTEAEIKGNCYFTDGKQIWQNHVDVDAYINLYKITGQFKDQLKGVPLFTLPEERVDVDELASGCIEKHKNEFDNWRDMAHAKVGYTMGYNRCLSDNKERKYTEQNIEDAIEFGLQYAFDQRFAMQYMKDKDRFIQSLTTPNLQQYDGKECEIEWEENPYIEYKDMPTSIGGQEYLRCEKTPKPKLTNGKITIIKIK